MIILLGTQLQPRASIEWNENIFVYHLSIWRLMHNLKVDFFGMGYFFLTHLGQDEINICHFANDISKCIFLNENI